MANYRPGIQSGDPIQRFSERAGYVSSVRIPVLKTQQEAHVPCLHSA